MEAIYIYPELSAPNKTGYCRLYIRLDYQRKRVGSESIQQKILKDDWDPEKRRVKKSSPYADLVNAILDNKIVKHNNFVLRRQAFGLPVTKVVLEAYIRSSSAFENFFDFARNVIETKRLKDGQPYAEDTKRRYKDEIKRMMQFTPELHFNRITVTWLEKYKIWLQHTYLKKDNTKLDKNSIWKALGFIRMVYNEAIKAEVIIPDENPFKKFDVGSYEQNDDKIKFLDIKQVNEIEQLLLTNNNLSYKTQAVGWRFLAMCVSGMRISDAMILDECFFNDVGDLQFNPQKTKRHNNTANIPLTTERQRRYIKKAIAYKLPPVSAKNYRTTFNNYLKVIAAHAGITINLTSHVGRHTMGGLIVDAGIEDRPAMAMLGIKSKKTIETYMHLKQDKLRQEALKLGNVM